MSVTRSTVPPPTRRTSRRETVTVQGTPGDPPSVHLPLSQTGIPIPYIIGLQRVFQPNILWYGNLKPITETIREVEVVEEEIRYWQGAILITETVTKEIITETVNIIGYKVDMKVGICLGPGVHLRAINVNNTPIWQGDIGVGITDFTVTSNTFINGEVTFASGEFDQTVPPYLEEHLAEPVANVGVAYLLVKDIDVSQELGQLSFDVYRAPNPLGLATDDNELGDDINIVSAIADIMSNSWGAGGLDTSDFGSSFATSAALAKIENNSCAIIIQHEATISEILKILQDQFYCIIFENPSTGLIELNPIRYSNTVDYSEVTFFDENNIIDVRNFDKTSWAETIEQLRGTFTDRANNYDTAPVFAQNFANLSSGRGKRSSSIDYPACMSKSLATDLLARDLAKYNAPLFTSTIVSNRRGASLVPGDLISINWSRYGILNEILFCQKIRIEPIFSNNVVIHGEQYRIPDTSAIYAPPDDSFFVPVDSNPKIPTAIEIISAPFWMAREAGTGISSIWNYQFNYPLFLPTPANIVQSSFSVFVDNAPGTDGLVKIIPPANGQSGVYPTIGDLDSIISRFDGFDTGIIPSIIINNVINDVHLIAENGHARDIGETGVRNGLLLLLIGNEILSFESATQLTADSWQLNNVHRGLIDTTAKEHLANSQIFIIPNRYTNIPENYFVFPPEYTPEFEIIGNAPGKPGRIEDGTLTSLGWMPAFNRIAPPYRPQDTRIEGERSQTPFAMMRGAVYTVSWATRNRATATIQLQADAAEEGEVDSTGDYQIHRVFVKDIDLGETVPYASQDQLTIEIPMGMSLGEGNLYVRAETVFGNSNFDDLIPIEILPATFFESEDEEFYFVSEDGTEIYVTEGS